MGGKPVKRQILPRDWRKERGPDFHPAQLLRTNSLLIDAALRTTHHFTHSNRISRLTNSFTIPIFMSPASHQFWGRSNYLRSFTGRKPDVSTRSMDIGAGTLTLSAA